MTSSPIVSTPEKSTDDPSKSTHVEQPKSKPSHANGQQTVHNGDPHSRSYVAPHQPTRKSSLMSTIFWVTICVFAAAGWFFQEQLKPVFAKLQPYLQKIFPSAKPLAAKPPRITPVSAAPVRQRDLPLYLNGLGTVTAFKTVTMRSRVEGELVNVAFTEGQMVNEGDLLAEIDPRPFQVQLSQAESMLARDSATLKTARTTLARYEGLLAQKSIAPQQYDDQVQLVSQTTAAIQTDESMIANAKLQLTFCRITAPISGRIGLRLVDKGNIVRANDLIGLAVITQLQPIAVVFTIPQDDISRVQKRYNQEVMLPVDVYDRDFKLKLASGKLVAIDNQVDATTGTVRLKAQFENEDGMLFPNQFVNARLLLDTRPGAIVVPSAAVQRGPTSMFVYVVKAEKGEKEGEVIETVELKNVVTGPSEGAETSIESGLTPGEIVVTDGIDKLQSGAKVVTRKPGDKKKGESGKPGADKGGAQEKGDKAKGDGKGASDKAAGDKTASDKAATNKKNDDKSPKKDAR